VSGQSSTLIKSDTALWDKTALKELMEVNKEIDHTVHMIGLISSSKPGGELCRRLATDEILGDGTLGVQFYLRRLASLFIPPV